MSVNNLYIIIIKKRKQERCQLKWKVSFAILNTHLIVEYWRRRYQRMNTERFAAANLIALVTHTAVRMK
jgi:hypothetical protein